MELIKYYLEKVQEIQGVFFLRVDEEKMTDELAERIMDQWESMHDDPLIIMPFQFDINYQNTYSFYIAMMLVNGRMRITRKKWTDEHKNHMWGIPYLDFDESGVLCKIFPNSDQQEFFLITKEDMDAADFIILGGL